MQEFLNNQTPETIKLLVLGLVVLIGIIFTIIIIDTVRYNRKIKKFRKNIRGGDQVRICSEYGPQGKIVEINNSEIYVLVKLTDTSILKKTDRIFPPLT